MEILITRVFTDSEYMEYYLKDSKFYFICAAYSTLTTIYVYSRNNGVANKILNIQFSLTTSITVSFVK